MNKIPEGFRANITTPELLQLIERNNGALTVASKEIEHLNSVNADLLAALEALVNFDQAERDMGCQSYVTGSPVYKLWVKARAAIAKAKE